MEKYYIELTQSNGDRVSPVERYETTTEAKAVSIFEKLIKKAREEKNGNGARILYGWNYDNSGIVEIWGRW